MRHHLKEEASRGAADVEIVCSEIVHGEGSGNGAEGVRAFIALSCQARTMCVNLEEGSMISILQVNGKGIRRMRTTATNTLISYRLRRFG